MSKYTLYFTQTMSTSVQIEADSLDDALDAAYDSDQMPTGICAQCSGWGQPWSVDTSDSWEFDESSYEVDGKTVTA